ncbi:MAG: glycoside hydrolase family 26 protein [Solirubrobacterales bacterium]
MKRIAAGAGVLAALILLGYLLWPMMTLMNKPNRHFFYYQGMVIDVPGGMTVDESLANAFVRFSKPDLDIKISKERVPISESDTGEYVEHYLYKYLLDPEYRSLNRITLASRERTEIAGYPARVFIYQRAAAPGSKIRQNEYYHAIIQTGIKEFYCVFCRSGDIDSQIPAIQSLLASFQRVRIPIVGRPGGSDFKPEPPVWNDETQAFYSKMKQSRQIMWGLFYPHSITRDYSRFEKIEKELDYTFPLTLHYLYLGEPFPTEGMNNAYRHGQTVELTMQVMYNVQPGNTDRRKHNVNFEVMDGQYDPILHQFARDLKAFGHPVIFRLNNEMNTTWTPFSGIALMCDPDLNIAVWRHIADIFREEGVQNAIWVFNPNDRNYPPMNWNRHFAYYPGNRYVQLVGLTGYNTGNYYEKTTGEKWRSFSEIYDTINREYSHYYTAFPWIITEFASSSVGGDKAEWIRDMFEHVNDYPNLKAAIWWSYTDFDVRPGRGEIPARRYWLDEKPEYLKAFKEGLDRQRAEAGGK